jgi:NAD(P)-dependent dehydrogenase (short-subunit alcohol dehydrogenase family)
MKRLDQKVVIVTGGSQGIGKAFCLALAAEGAKVVSVARHGSNETVGEIKSKGGEALDFKGDITTAADMLKMAETVISKYGRIDVLVNHAGISWTVPFKDLTFDDWKKVQATNLDGLFHCTKAVFPYMMNQKYGKIINVTSDTFFHPCRLTVHYTTTKGGIIGFTHALASEAAEYGITVNCLAPGLIATNSSMTTSFKDFFGWVLDDQDIKRPGTPEDLTGALLFMASDESAFMTGQTITINGGVTRS